MPPLRGFAAAIAAILVLSANASGSESSPTGAACPATVPTRTVPRDAGFAVASFNYGNRYLRAHLHWRDGPLRAGRPPGIGYGATVEADGSIRTKVGWWRGLSGTLVIAGHRLDASAPALLPTANDIGYGPSGFVPSSLIFPTVGCWKVVGTLRRARLTFVGKAIKVEQ